MITPGRILDSCCAALGLADPAAVQLHHGPRLLAAAASLAGQGGPAAEVRSWGETQGRGPYAPPALPFPLLPGAPAIIWWDAPLGDAPLGDAPLGDAPPGDAPLGRLCGLLAARYQAGHPADVLALDAAGAVTALDRLTLSDLPYHTAQHAALAIHLPALPIASDWRGPEGLAWVVARLLAPGGCPWDVRQTHQSLRGALLEEAYEVIEALDAGDMAGLSEELGDLLISVFAHSEMARQAGAFGLGDVLGQVTAKLIRRHPHVFGDLTVDGEGQVLQNWEQIKAAELAEKGRARPSALDGVPPALPALAAAQKLGKKAARAGFNWASQDQVWAKLYEELEEIAAAAAAGDPAHVAEELGDALFALTRLAAWLDVDAETALREANAKFRRRFTFIERAAAAESRSLSAMSLAEMLAHWRAAKAQA